MVRAVRSSCAANGIELNDQLFLAGYSEGGYATMAAHREIETMYPDEFTVTASAPAAGPYDLSGTMFHVALSDTPVPNPYYFPYLLLAYNDIYGLADSYRELLADPFTDSIPLLFDGNHGSDEINGVLPPAPREILSPALTQQSGAPESALLKLLKTALRENDLYRWTPRAPMRIYHCTGDHDVPYAASTTAYQSFVERGAADVQLITPGSGDHASCVIPTYFLIKGWFDSLL
jgi:hypothetical protein